MIAIGRYAGAGALPLLGLLPVFETLTESHDCDLCLNAQWDT